MGTRIPHQPKIFHVNWFRKGADGRFLWPGYGENVRILKWIVERIRGGGRAVETPIGHVPAPGSLDEAGAWLAPGGGGAAVDVGRGGGRGGGGGPGGGLGAVRGA